MEGRIRNGANGEFPRHIGFTGFVKGITGTVPSRGLPDIFPWKAGLHTTDAANVSLSVATGDTTTRTCKIRTPGEVICGNNHQWPMPAILDSGTLSVW